MIAPTECLTYFRQTVTRQLLTKRHCELSRSRNRTTAALRKELGHADLEVFSARLLHCLDCDLLSRHQILQRLSSKLERQGLARELCRRCHTTKSSFEFSDVRTDSTRSALGFMHPFGDSVLKTLLGLACGAGLSIAATAQPSADVDGVGRELDAKLFGAYNACDLEAFGELLAQDLEFYDDRDGLTLGRQAVVDAVHEYICGKVRRELISGSLKSFPMDKYGLVQFGEHRFCTVGTTTCTGVGRFVHLWRQSEGKWQATRIISYDHQPL